MSAFGSLLQRYLLADLWCGWAVFEDRPRERHLMPSKELGDHVYLGRLLFSVGHVALDAGEYAEVNSGETIIFTRRSSLAFGR